MAWEQPGFKVTSLTAPSSAWANRQYYGVSVSSSSPFIKVAVNNVSSSESPIGILQNTPTVAGEDAEIIVDGVSKAFCLTAVSAGGNYVFSTNGAIIASSSRGAKDTTWGPVLESAAASGIATVLVRPIGITT